jgi:hypothetical protein
MKPLLAYAEKTVKTELEQSPLKGNTQLSDTNDSFTMQQKRSGRLLQIQEK